MDNTRMLIAVRLADFLERITTYIMSFIPKLFDTRDVIDYKPEPPPADSSDDDEELFQEEAEEWQVIREEKKKTGWWFFGRSKQN